MEKRAKILVNVSMEHTIFKFLSSLADEVDWAKHEVPIELWMDSEGVLVIDFPFEAIDISLGGYPNCDSEDVKEFIGCLADLINNCGWHRYELQVKWVRKTDEEREM